MSQKDVAESLHKAFDGSGDSSKAVHLSSEEASAFFDTVVDQSVMLKKCRVEKIDLATKNLQRLISDGEFLRAGTGAAGFNDNDADKVTPTTIPIVTREVQGSIFILDSEKRHNIEGQSIGEHILNMVGKKTSNSLERMSLISDMSNAAFTGTQSAYKVNDGWLKLIKNGGNYLDAALTTLFADASVTREKFIKMYTALPVQYREMADFFLHDNVIVEYDELFTGNYNRNNLIDNILTRPLVKVPLMATAGKKSQVLLTDPKNLIVAFQMETSQIQFEKFRNPKMKRDEWYFNMEVGFQVEVPEAAVLLDNLTMKY